MRINGTDRQAVDRNETDKPHQDRDPAPKKRRVYEEAAKTRETTHWDLDYLPMAEIDALDKAGRKAQSRTLLQRLKDWWPWR